MHLVPRRVLVIGFLLSSLSYAQLKNPRLPTPSLGNIEAGGHHILQFGDTPTPELVNELTARGIRVLGDIPGNSLLVTAGSGSLDLEDLGLHFADRLAVEDKLSPMLADQDYLIVEFHSDVAPESTRSLILNLGLELRENPDLRDNHLMIRRPLSLRAIRRLAALDEVAYIFPASEELVRGSYVVACAGALTMNGTAGQLIASYGDGWDGPGRNPTTLNYTFSQMTTKLPASTAQSEVLRAMNEWSKVIQLTWKPGTNANATRTVNVLFAAGAHGDSYPFDGPGKVLAHTYYPSPPNPEPIAGDMHLDDDESWRVGANIDLFSVALHELGHALGLGHSDSPNDVMYPYYRIASTLAAGDKTAILGLYAPAGTTSTTAPPPPSRSWRR